MPQTSPHLKKPRNGCGVYQPVSLTGQEKERAFLARELHDELGQVLTALRMEAVWIRNRVKKTDPTASARALTMCELIDTTIEEVRGLAIRLRPGVLDHLGLVEAIEWYTADFEKRYDITCVFEHDDGPEIRGKYRNSSLPHIPGGVDQCCPPRISDPRQGDHVALTMAI